MKVASFFSLLLPLLRSDWQRTDGSSLFKTSGRESEKFLLIYVVDHTLPSLFASWSASPSSSTVSPRMTKEKCHVLQLIDHFLRSVIFESFLLLFLLLASSPLFDPSFSSCLSSLIEFFLFFFFVLIEDVQHEQYKRDREKERANKRIECSQEQLHRIECYITINTSSAIVLVQRPWTEIISKDIWSLPRLGSHSSLLLRVILGILFR